MRVEELFVVIKGYPNYEVSNYGRVVNVNTDKDLKPWESSKGNKKLMVKLYCSGISKVFFVHRLVAQAFFVDYDEFVDVYHISSNKQDNCVTNLHLEKPYG